VDFHYRQAPDTVGVCRDRSGLEWRERSEDPEQDHACEEAEAGTRHR
jgi:hypothetical protein